MDKIKRLKELTEQLNHYRDSYYNNSESLISDKQYDDLFDELQSLEEEPFIGIDGFGKEMCKSLKSWWVNNKELFYDLIDEFSIEKNENNSNGVDLSGKTFVITGSLKLIEQKSTMSLA